MKKIIVVFMLLVISSITIAQISKDGKVEQLKNREDIKVTEVENDLLKIEYPNGKVMLKNIADYQYPESSIQHQVTYSPTFDSTIIDLTTIDTTLYYQKYSFWQEVPIHNWEFDHLMIGDVNKNEKPELYGARKFFETEQEPTTVYELNSNGIFESIYQYDSVYISRSIYDVDNDGKEDVLLTLPPIFGITTQQRFFSKENDTTLATQLSFIFAPYEYQSQLNDFVIDDLDDDKYSDLLFIRSGEPDVHIFEYNPTENNFDSVYRFDVSEPPPWGTSGFSVGDFDIDGKTDMVFGTGRGVVYVLENEGDNQYTNSWNGNVETFNAYIHTWTHDVDKNGKPEFWVLGDGFFNGASTTRITLFETNGDNSYEAVGRIDLIGVFSFYAGTMQAVDIDNDGTDEVAICIDDNFLILKFNGSEGDHTYELYYIKRNKLPIQGEFSIYFGATMHNLFNKDKFEILISMIEIIVQPGEDLGRFITQIYKPNNASGININETLPDEIELYQNYPNPFNPSTNIKFALNEFTNVSIKVYNILGKEIRLLLEDNLPTGEYDIQWNGKDDEGNTLSGGVYFIQMVADGYQKTIKAVLLK
jgi:Secretion system C-terminal sorting domain/FG-GAP-like repeat